MANTQRNDTCWLCGKPLDESNEHVLPESITFKSSLTVAGFICTRCNNATGSKWDEKLAAVCRYGFKADTKYPPRLRQSGPRFTPAEYVTIDGETIAGSTDYEGNFRPNPTPPVEEDLGDGIVRVFIQGAADDRRIIEQVEQTRKWFGSDRFLSEYKTVEPVRGTVAYDVELHWGAIRKALVKSYTALAFHLGIQPSMCDIGAPFLRNERRDILLQSPPIVLVNDRAVKYKHITMVYSVSKFLFGSAHISGFPPGMTKAEYFGNELYVESLVPALLSRRYEGPPIMQAYVVDVIDSKYDVVDMRQLLDEGTIKLNSDL